MHAARWGGNRVIWDQSSKSQRAVSTTAAGAQTPTKASQANPGSQVLRLTYGSQLSSTPAGAVHSPELGLQ